VFVGALVCVYICASVFTPKSYDFVMIFDWCILDERY